MPRSVSPGRPGRDWTGCHDGLRTPSDPTVGGAVSAPGRSVPRRARSCAPSLNTLYDELRVLRYEEGRSIHLDWRNLPDERAAREVAQEFVRDRLQAIVAFANQAVRAPVAATAEVPIIFIHVDDPVANGFVQRHAQPGGNVTGFEGEAWQIPSSTSSTSRPLRRWG